MIYPEFLCLVAGCSEVIGAAVNTLSNILGIKLPSGPYRTVEITSDL